MGMKEKGKSKIETKLPDHKVPKGKKASEKTSKDQSAKSAKMGSSSESFGDSDVKQGFKPLPKIASAADANTGEYMYKPGSTNNDSRTIMETSDKKKK
jgi:hypothetical protein